ncbi:hypothetical protein MCON_3548 (plasmid) [Methanothrix soehngenii GP6]|uniref:Uncharacterized protein n=1 Tax=Methanothrix soehngenii (strain ATCC 5969 / DSM 3671 / JCM 10134 / NBRC 103675 / OCM 69 / GP-6) TaxID=990316 RepID=F4C0W2_METSG|nr:hypothetical protein MCON_3548 [Methanothrix soehngenii GP6]
MRAVERWMRSSIFCYVQLAEFGARLRSDRKMWLLMVNGALGWRWMENLRGGMRHEPYLKYCFYGSILINLFLTTHPIKIVLTHDSTNLLPTFMFCCRLRAFKFCRK